MKSTYHSCVCQGFDKVPLAVPRAHSSGILQVDADLQPMVLGLPLGAHAHLLTCAYGVAFSYSCFQYRFPAMVSCSPVPA